MIPLGLLNSGGRSSNLSPLAPPFTLDKPYHRQQTSKPPVTSFGEAYGWSPSRSSAFGNNLMENGSKDASFPPPQDVHGFPSTLSEVKPYYSPYVVADDGEMVPPKEPNYDLLSNFAVAQVDDTRSVSGVKYTPQWNGIWNGLNDVEQGNWLEIGGNYASSKDHKHSESSTGQQGTRKESSAKAATCFESFCENSFGSPSIEDRKSFKESNPVVSSARLCTLGSEMNQDPFLQQPLPSYGFCKGPVDSQDKHTNYSNSYVFDSTSTMVSSPASKKKITFVGFPSPKYAAPSVKVDTVRNESVDKTEKSLDFLPYHPFGLNFHVSNYTGNTDGLFTGLSSNKLESNINNKQVNVNSFDNPFSTVPHLSMAESRKIKGDTGDTFCSMDKFSDGPDIQNPAEDSPCWKGARFSPFQESKMVTPDAALEMSESCFDRNGEEEHMNNPVRLYITDAIDTNENLASKRSSIEPVSRYHDGPCPMMQGLHNTKLSCEDGLQSFDKKHSLDLGIGSDSGSLKNAIVSSSNKSQPLQIHSNGCEIFSEETDAGLKGKTSSNGVSCSPTTGREEMLPSPSGNVAASVATQLSGKDSKVDFNVLVNSMMNMSQILVSHCLNGPNTSAELDQTSLKHIISNLNSCLLKKVDQAIQTEKFLDPQLDTSFAQGSLQAQTISQVTSARVEQHDHDFFESWNSDIQGLGNEDHPGSSEVKGNEDTVRDAGTIQAIKSVLEMNFPSEEMLPETVLYKNLWLEAEAALCATTVKSRFNRMKKETEKAKRVYLRTNAEEPIPNSKASDVNKASGSLPHEANDSPSSDMKSSDIPRFQAPRSMVENPKPTNPISGQKRPSHDTEVSQTQSRDFEASVMARFQTLKSRPDNSNPASTEDEKSPPIPDNLGPPSPDQSMEDSYFSNMANHPDVPEAGFMSRFEILKARMGQSDSSDSSNVENLTGSFSASLKCAGNKARKVNGLGDELLEGWYDCSEPGWEHVTNEAALKHKYFLV